jgi:succinate-semialdehyde dehydrogenase/glutarate-semialdehyde dehydrogenase|tara:strand:+ start:2292 stop:3731 length:1440 start_codon:yes stop_codon:yes gene_type:complete
MAYEKLELLINGKWRQGSDNKAEPVYNPATSETIGDLPHASKADLDEALESNAEAFKSWRNEAPLNRQKIIENACRILESRSNEVAENLTKEMGKPLAEAKGELAIGLDVLRWYGEEGKRAYGRIVPSRMPGMSQTVLKDPIGPVIAFVAWNFPVMNVVRKVGGALAAGCTITIKPSEETPGTAIAIGRALMEAGLPAGVLNIVFGVPSEVSEHLCSSSIPRKLSFTGSIPVGKHLQKLAAENMIRCTMELGGHSPLMVFDDTDIAAAAKISVAGKFRNAGQVCVSPTRFLVQDSVKDQFIKAVLDETNKIKVGNGLEDGIVMGPLIADRRIEIMDSFVKDAVDSGAELNLGGHRLNRDGSFYAPTVLSNVSDNAKIMNEEPFGPLLPIDSFKSVDEVIDRANRLEFGLASYAFTNDPKIVNALRSEIQAGLLAINSTAVSTPETPFGGVKHSGYGSEGGVEGLDAFLVTRFISEIYNI